MIGVDDRAPRHAVLCSNAAHRSAGLYNNLLVFARCGRCLLRGIRAWRGSVRRSAVHGGWRLAGSDKPESCNDSCDT
jgi:hypothetical protein